MDDEKGEKERKPAAKKPMNKEAALLGLGLDGTDGHTRITTGKNFKLVGGSKDTHEAMQETAIKVIEELDRRRKRLEDVKPKEFREILEKARPQ